MFGLDYKALPKGPVPTALLDEIKRGGGADLRAAIALYEVKDEITDELLRRDLKPRVAFDKKWFSKRELKIMDRVAEFFLEFRAEDMSEFSHGQKKPWTAVFNKGKGQGQLIPPDLVRDGEPMDAFKKRPAMSQIYASYLAKFLHNYLVSEFLITLLKEKSLVDWQKLWALAALSQMTEAKDASVKVAMSILKDGDRHETLRAVAAIYVGKFGDHQRRKSLVTYYGSVSPYIQAAIYFSSRQWPGIERSNAKASWGSQGSLNSLLTSAIAKK
jgi:hypothetical protein